MMIFKEVLSSLTEICLKKTFICLSDGKKIKIIKILQ